MLRSGRRKGQRPVIDPKQLYFRGLGLPLVACTWLLLPCLGLDKQHSCSRQAQKRVQTLGEAGAAPSLGATCKYTSCQQVYFARWPEADAKVLRMSTSSRFILRASKLYEAPCYCQYGAAHEPRPESWHGPCCSVHVEVEQGLTL